MTFPIGLPPRAGPCTGAIEPADDSPTISFENDRKQVPEAETANPFIRRLQAFADLSADDRAAIEGLVALPQIVDSNVDLARDDETPDATFLILEGYACRYRHRETGARQIVTHLLAGDLSEPDMVFLDRRDYAIGTLSLCRVVRIPHGAAALLLARHPAIAHALRMIKLVEDAILRERVISLGSRSAIERTAHLFCELLVRHEAVGGATGDRFSMPLRQLDLADTMGLSNVHMNRVLQELRRQNLVNLSNKTLEILNLPRLRTLGEFKAAYLHPVPAAP